MVNQSKFAFGIVAGVLLAGVISAGVLTATAQTTNHLLHIILCVCTFGLWLFIYPLVGLASMASGCRCTVCGHPVERQR